MARLNVVTPETATPEQKAILDQTAAKFGKHPILLSVLTNSTAAMNS